MDHVRTLRAAALLLVVTTAAACSDGGSSSSTTLPSTSAPSTVASTTIETVAVTDPTVVDTTEATGPETTDPTPSTTELPASTAPMTLPDGVPPRVTFPDDPELQAVVDAFYAYYDAIAAALNDPSNPVLRDGVLETTGDPQRERVASFITRLVTDDEAVRQSGDVASYTEVVAPSVLALDDLATLDVCLIDTSVRVEVGANADGSDRVINDEIVSVSDTYSFERIGDRWVVVDIVRADRWEGQLGCG